VESGSHPLVDGGLVLSVLDLSVSTSTLALIVSTLAFVVSTLVAAASLVAWRRRRLAVSVSFVQFSLERLHKPVNERERGSRYSSLNNEARSQIEESRKARSRIEEKLPLVVDRKLRKALEKLLATCEEVEGLDHCPFYLEEQFEQQLRYARKRTLQLRRRSMGFFS
jgi:hypothetical protein